MKPPSHPLPEEALDRDIAILGAKGRGKSYTAKGIVEQQLDRGWRVCVLDPLGHWWGLRSSADGLSPGYPVAVFGGAHADMPLSAEIARPLAEILAAENLPAVLDLSGMRKAEQARLLVPFLDELFTRTNEPLTLVLEEADVFAAQNPQGEMVGVFQEVDRIARRGRDRGFRLLSLTQRAARLHKDVLTQLSTLIALGVKAPQDRDAIKAWVEGNADRDQAKAVLDSLADLPVGEGWVWAPDFGIFQRVRFPAIRTLDTSSTPKRGARRVEPKTLADVDVSAIRAALETAAADAAAATASRRPVQVTPAEEAPAPDAEEMASAKRREFERGVDEGLRRGRAALAQVLDRIDAAVGEVQAIVVQMHPNGPTGGEERQDADASEVRPLKRDVDPGPKTQALDPPAPTANAPIAASAEPEPAKAFTSTALDELVAALDTKPPIRVTWHQAAILAGLKPSSGYWRRTAATATMRGVVLVEDGTVRLAAPSPNAPLPPGPKEIVGRIRPRLQPFAATILGTLLTRGAMTPEQLGRFLGKSPTSGYWRRSMKELRGSGLIEETNRKLDIAAWMRGDLTKA